MATDYGKLAYYKAEEIYKKIDYSDDPNRQILFAYGGDVMVYDTPMYNHQIKSYTNELITAHFELDIDVAVGEGFKTTIYVNDVPIYESSKLIFDFSFISSGIDNVYIQFVGVDTITINRIKIMYIGKLKNIFDNDIIYLEEVNSGFNLYRNGVMNIYSSIDELISSYKFVTPTKEALCVIASVTSTKKTGFYGLIYDEETQYIKSKNFVNGLFYSVKQVKPDIALMYPASSAVYRMVYALDGKLYFFNSSRYGTNKTDTVEIPNINYKEITSLFPIVVNQNVKIDMTAFGVVADGKAYVFRYDSNLENYVSKKYIGECDYASGFYDADSVSIVLYKNGVATIKTYSDKSVTNLISSKTIYNCYKVLYLGGGLIGLNYNGLFKIST